jgi:Fe-S-cluster formation regulator IscX/YfhJ
MNNLTWDDCRPIAIILNKKFPRTDVLSLNDTKLLDMMREASILDKLPEISDDKRKDFLFAIKCSLSRIIEGDEDYNAHQKDAFV